ncbi:hypothetical protein OUZ56_026305 [Daphnia magna]|uniref:Uncharacterized protein n=1 Tax=Daphnia magna TaxID=35525 RepID=A0ABQ9ZLC9_9CRUS|nr:hypothetical protein OUZ56_026305 [Daphnia magna]
MLYWYIQIEYTLPNDREDTAAQLAAGGNPATPAVPGLRSVFLKEFQPDNYGLFQETRLRSRIQETGRPEHVRNAPIGTSFSEFDHAFQKNLSAKAKNMRRIFGASKILYKGITHVRHTIMKYDSEVAEASREVAKPFCGLSRPASRFYEDNA